MSTQPTPLLSKQGRKLLHIFIISKPKNKIVKVILLSILLFTELNSFAFANMSSLSQIPKKIIYDESSLSSYREIYSRAQKLADRGNWRQLKLIKRNLEGYPLYPYLDYKELLEKMSIPNRGKISNFLATHKDSVLAYRLRSKWLEYLARRAQWNHYLKYYAPEEASISRQCQYFEALYHRQRQEEALKGGIALWTVGHSQPRQCDPLFRILIRHKAITTDHAWERFNHSVRERNYSLATYANQFITDTKTKKLTESFLKIKQNPNYLHSAINILMSNKSSALLVAYTLGDLANHNPMKAHDLWFNWDDRVLVADEDSHKFISKLVKSFIKNDANEDADRVLHEYAELINTDHNGDLIEWRIRHALGEQNWTDVEKWIGKLPHTMQKKSIWRYWHIQSLENNIYFQRQHADKLKKQLAEERDFYGFVISDKLHQNYNLNYKPAPIDKTVLYKVEANDALKRARELHFHGNKVEATREWNSATRNFDRAQWIAAAQLTHEWNWHSRAIIAMASAKYWDDLDIRFPLAFEPSINSVSINSNVQPHLLFAIARQESAFELQAVSRAGAVGLLQIMPQTAKSTAMSLNIPYKNSRQLFEIEKNLLIGSSYLKSLLKRYDNNRILALASYNAGPERVSTWLSRSGGKLTFDLWIELIPFRETRNYVKSVLMYSAIYSHKTGSQKRMLEPYEIELLL